MTVKVYEVPLVRPVTAHDVVAVVHVNEPGDEVTVYPVIVAPPLLAGAVHDTVAWAAPETPTTEVGAPGTASGVTEPEEADDELLPTPFEALTVNV